MNRILAKGLLVAFIAILSIIGNTVVAQEGVLTAGFQVKPIIPFKFVGEETVTGIVENEMQMDISPKVGYSYGMVVRWGILDWLSLETGINYTRRNYKLEVTDLMTDSIDLSDFGLVSYEIPVQGLVYIRLGENLYMNTAFGGSINWYASKLATVGNDLNLQQNTFRRKRLQLALLANIGFELRTENSGYFYIGASLHRPFDYIAVSNVRYWRDSFNFFTKEVELTGNYLTLDFRYFFHEEKKKDRRN